MNIQHIVKMANQIGGFFQNEPDQAQAGKDIAAHLKLYWEPRMRKAIVAHVAAGGAGLLPIVIDAVVSHGRELAVPLITGVPLEKLEKPLPLKK